MCQKIENRNKPFYNSRRILGNQIIMIFHSSNFDECNTCLKRWKKHSEETNTSLSSYHKALFRVEIPRLVTDLTPGDQERKRDTSNERLSEYLQINDERVVDFS